MSYTPPARGQSMASANVRTPQRKRADAHHKEEFSKKTLQRLPTARNLTVAQWHSMGVAGSTRSGARPRRVLYKVLEQHSNDKS